MQNFPLVTIYIPTYNRLNLLKRAIESVRNQTYTNLEIIVVDDKSSDGTQEFLEKISLADTRIKFILKEQNSGACISRNMAIEHATGLYITGLDDDDFFPKNRIEILVDNINLLDEYSFLYTYYLTLTKSGKFKKTRFVSFLLPTIISSRDILFKNIIGNQCFTLTERMKEAGKFTPEMPAWQDLDLFYRLLIKGKYKKAYLIKVPLYIQDTSHDLNRITLSNKKKINDAFELFCTRNFVVGKEKSILQAQLISYGIKVKYSVFLNRLLSTKKFYFYLVDFFLLLKNLKNNENLQ
ncbi:glycosyltransferase [Sodalis sp. RH16]|uniref:glycosyltransferase n=1 Tax=Sodalis sp. RH16 TaxID=3394331 RepID=UPI0039B5BCE1